MICLPLGSNTKFLKKSYGYSRPRVGLRVARKVVRKFVVDHRSTAVLDGSAAVTTVSDDYPRLYTIIEE